MEAVLSRGSWERGGEAGPGLAKRTLTEWHDGSSREGDVCSRVPGMNPGTPVEGNEERGQHECSADVALYRAGNHTVLSWWPPSTWSEGRHPNSVHRPPCKMSVGVKYSTGQRGPARREGSRDTGRPFHPGEALPPRVLNVGPSTQIGRFSDIVEHQEMIGETFTKRNY